MAKCKNCFKECNFSSNYCEHCGKLLPGKEPQIVEYKSAIEATKRKLYNTLFELGVTQGLLKRERLNKDTANRQKQNLKTSFIITTIVLLLACGFLGYLKWSDMEFNSSMTSNGLKYGYTDKTDCIDIKPDSLALALFNLGLCYEKGYGVKRSYPEAIKWYRKAAEQGNAWARNNLGNCYYSGQGVNQNYDEAVKWFRKAAEQGNATAQYNLGNCYYNGCGVVQNYDEAVNWHRKAAEQGNAGAQNDLGVCYYNGQGVDKNYDEAVNWYRKAAEQGNATAQYNLGLCYEYGKGVDKNHIEAANWYRKAAEQGHNRAKSALNAITQQ